MLSLFPRTPPAPCLEEHYGLARRPFGLTLDQHFLYPSRAYTRALEEVCRAIDRREGLVVVTGETGAGKTMLCRTLVERLEAACVSVVLDPHVTVEDLLLHVLTDFGAVASPRGPVAQARPTRHQLMRALQQCLASLAPSGACAVLVIDEAQHLDPSVLEQLRLLLNLETNDAKLLQIVLVGDPSLERQLQRPELRALEQRIARRAELPPLTAGEVERYVRHRLTVAERLALASGLEGLQSGRAAIESVPCHVSFTPAAMRAVARQSAGIPRLVNLLCDRALEIGHEQALHTIRARTVRAAAMRVSPYVGRVPRSGPAGFVIAAAAIVIACAAGARAWPLLDRGDVPAVPPAPLAFAAVVSPGAPPASVAPIDVFDKLDVWSGPVVPPAAVVPAPDVRLLRVALVRDADRVSLAIEMTAEPHRAVLRALSGNVLELEVGPVAGPVRREELTPRASDASPISRIAIAEHGAAGGEVFIRARLVLAASGRGDVRVAGRVVYVDITNAASAP